MGTIPHVIDTTDSIRQIWLPNNNSWHRQKQFQYKILVQDCQKIHFYSFLSDDSGFWENFVRHLCLFFSTIFQFSVNFVSPSRNAPRFTPLPTRMLVTPIFETYSYQSQYLSNARPKQTESAKFTSTLNKKLFFLLGKSIGGVGAGGAWTPLPRHYKRHWNHWGVPQTSSKLNKKCY